MKVIFETVVGDLPQGYSFVFVGQEIKPENIWVVISNEAGGVNQAIWNSFPVDKTMVMAPAEILNLDGTHLRYAGTVSHVSDSAKVVPVKAKLVL